MVTWQKESAFLLNPSALIVNLTFEVLSFAILISILNGVHITSIERLHLCLLPGGLRGGVEVISMTHLQSIHLRHITCSTKDSGTVRSVCIALTLNTQPWRHSANWSAFSSGCRRRESEENEMEINESLHGSVCTRKISSLVLSCFLLPWGYTSTQRTSYVFKQVSLYPTCQECKTIWLKGSIFCRFDLTNVLLSWDETEDVFCSLRFQQEAEKTCCS